MKILAGAAMFFIAIPANRSTPKTRGVLMTFRRSVPAFALLAAFTFTSAYAAEAASTTTPPATTAQRFGTWGFDVEGMD